MSWCNATGKTPTHDAAKYGKLSIMSYSKKGSRQPKHCKIAWPKAETER